MKILIEFIKSLFIKKIHTGVLPDDRLPQEKTKDYLYEEIFAPDAAKAIYRTKAGVLPITEKYFKENQHQTSSCVPHCETLCLGIDNELEGGSYVRLSKKMFYRGRSNYPEEGMSGDDAGKIGTAGVCLYDTLPSDPTEAEMNRAIITDAMRAEGRVYGARSYINIKQYTNIDILTSVISQGKGVSIFIFANKDEWSREYPVITDPYLKPKNAYIVHCVCILPNSGFMENGKKYVAVQDSAWFGALNIRYLSEDFIKARCYYAKFYLNMRNRIAETTAQKPTHTFTLVMRVGDEGEEVKWIQKCLQYEGLFPEGQDCTGLFGGITLKAVKEFQKKYYKDILFPLELTEPTGKVGPLTIVKLNQLYSK